MENSDSVKWRGRISAYAPLFLWIGVIFFLSTGQGSMSETSRFIRPLLEFLFPTAPEETLLLYHGYIRKFAHFAEYAVLAFFAVRAFSNSSLRFIKKYTFPAAFCIVLVIAVIDEINQSFWVSRSGSGYDVILDGCGGLTALSVLFLINSRWGKTKDRAPATD